MARGSELLGNRHFYSSDLDRTLDQSHNSYGPNFLVTSVSSPFVASREIRKGW